MIKRFVHVTLPQFVQGGSATGLSVAGALDRAAADDEDNVRLSGQRVDPQRTLFTHSSSKRLHVRFWASLFEGRKRSVMVWTNPQ
jgi:hypothetical protein